MDAASTQISDPNPTAFDLEGYVFSWIGQIDNYYARRVAQALRGLGVNVSCWRSLAALHHHGAMTVSQLSELSAIERSALSRSVDAMAERGLVRRVEHTGDRRMQNVEITPEGSALYHEIVPVILGLNAQATWNIDAAEIAQCIATLRRVRANISGRPGR